MVDEIPTPSSPPRTGSALLRVIWMLAIPCAGLCIFVVADHPTWTLGRADVALVLLVAAAVVARAVDALRYGGTTAQGDPAGRSHVIGYTARLVSIAGIAWFFAQSVDL